MAVATSESTAILQLVDSRGEFNKDGLENFAADHIPDPDNDPDADDADASTVVLIAILGARGSGKSLLANKLFSTSLPVSRLFSGAGTKGCMAAAAVPPTSSTSSPGAPLLVLDTQGSDGREGDNVVVSRVTTLCVALADALVFNVWAADLGRYDAAGYAQLTTIFVENVRIFRREEPFKTLIVFVIRDHDDGSSLDSLKRLLIADMHSLWGQIDAGGAALEDIFDMAFVSLPHVRHRAAEFDTAVKDLGARLTDPSHANYLLKPEHSRKVPVEGLYNYAEAVWKDTEVDRGGGATGSATSAAAAAASTPGSTNDRLLPSRKDLVAAYRCDVAYDAQARPALAQLNRWTSEVDRGRVVPAFGNKASTLLDRALERYDGDTLAHASSTIRAKKRSDLQSCLQARVRSLFNKQVLLLQNAALQRFKAILLDNVTDPGYETETPAAVRRVDFWFADNAEALLVPSMHLTFRSARQEVQNALRTYGEGFSNSPTAQLQAMQRMQRQAQRAPPRQTNVEVGLGINAACRPAGFGNFQLVTGYSRGPHTMQLTLVNDKDVAEQEGQGQVPLFRVQPTINTTLDL